MNLSEYSDYFHDGSLIDFKQLGTTIEISILSAEIAPEYMKANMPPLYHNRIQGKIYLNGVRKIQVNKKPFNGTLKKLYDSGSVLDFEVFNNKVILGIEWTNYPPKARKSDFTSIEIEAETIRWENIPELSDDYFKQGGGQS